MTELDCNEVVELVTAYLDDALTTDERDQVLAHLSRCDGCSTYVEQTRATIARLGALPAGGLDPDIRSHLLAQFRTARP